MNIEQRDEALLGSDFVDIKWKDKRMTVIHTVCLNPESGWFLAYLAATPEVQGESCLSREDAIGSLMREMAGFQIVDVDEIKP